MKMRSAASRFPENPLLSPPQLKAEEGYEISCLLNPGAFQFDDKIWLIVRVAERPVQKEGYLSFPVLENGTKKIVEIPKNDAALSFSDPRVLRYKDEDFLTTLSHLRLLCSDDGITFYEPTGYPRLYGIGEQESFGIEDCRVSFLNDKYFLTYTAVSPMGVGVGLRTTTDWKSFEHHGMILPPHNKDCAIFEEKINGLFYALHRPSSPSLGGNFIWLAKSPDGIHWGDHQCILRTRPGSWDSERIGAGAAPVKTEKGWVEIYHGANERQQYCLGAVLLDLYDPSIVLGRTSDPIMVPTEPYEIKGFFGNVVFTNGHIRLPDGDTLIIYYGAADEYVCGARLSVKEILRRLQ